MPGRPGITPAAVRDAALTLFAERGYHGTALSEVAGLLEIRTPSLYNHIASKQDLLAQIVLPLSQEVLDDLAAATEGVEPVAERLRAAVRVYALRHAVQRREALVLNTDVAALDEPWRSRVLDLRRRHERAIRDLIVEGVEAGVFTVDHPALASFGILEMCVAIARWFRDDGPLSPAEAADAHATFALRMVGFTGSDASKLR